MSSIRQNPDADAELIRLCGAFCELERQVHAVHGDEPEQGAKRDRLGALQSPIVSRIVDATANTIEGHAARACALIDWCTDAVAPGMGDTGERLTHALLVGLAGPEFVAEALERRRLGNLEGAA